MKNSLTFYLMAACYLYYVDFKCSVTDSKELVQGKMYVEFVAGEYKLIQVSANGRMFIQANECIPYRLASHELFTIVEYIVKTSQDAEESQGR